MLPVNPILRAASRSACRYPAILRYALRSASSIMHTMAMVLGRYPFLPPTPGFRVYGSSIPLTILATVVARIRPGRYLWTRSNDRWSLFFGLCHWRILDISSNGAHTQKKSTLCVKLCRQSCVVQRANLAYGGNTCRTQPLVADHLSNMC